MGQFHKGVIRVHIYAYITTASLGTAAGQMTQTKNIIGIYGIMLSVQVIRPTVILDTAL